MSTLRQRIASDVARVLSNLPTTKSAIFTASGDTVSRTFDVSFCPPYSQADMFDTGATNTSPLIFVSESDNEFPVKGDTYVIDGTTYYAQKVIPGGVGMSVVTLSNQASYG